MRTGFQIGEVLRGSLEIKRLSVNKAIKGIVRDIDE